MDKHLHKDIGEQFSQEINSLSQQPREHVWENIDKSLDKTDIKTYKDKFARLKKKSMLLLLLLIGISTFSVFYFNASKNTTHPLDDLPEQSLAGQKIKELIHYNEINNNITCKQEISLPNEMTQKQIGNINIPVGNTINNKEENFFTPRKIPVAYKGKTTMKITNGTTTEEASLNNEIENAKKNFPEKTGKAFLEDIANKPTGTEIKLALITDVSKKDSLTVTTDNLSLKKGNKKQRNINHRFTLTAFAAPDYSKYRLTNGKHSNYDNMADITTRERSDLSSSFGILFGYKVGNKISIQSGVIYSSTNISIAPTKIYAEKDNTGVIKFRYNTSSGYGYLLPSFSNVPAVGDSLFADGANHTLRYISIPIIAKYKLGNKKITFNPGVGITFDFLTTATLTTDLVDQVNRETEYISKLESIKKIGYSLIFTPEIQYQLSNKWSICAMPYFKYSLGAINKDNVVKTYPYTFGLGVGVEYKF